ncbi:MAG: LytR C-terminal domain-containing protein [Actinomycetia bacterium]|nr:LytR C-terminal domain-containing protein [Actinomycetes bacterium]
MSDYVYESGMSTQRRRQRRTAITLILTLLLLFGAFWWAWAYMREGDPATVSPTQTPTNGVTAGACDPSRDPREVTINVYNASNRSGLAGRIADELRERGFTVGRIANDPLGAAFAQPVQVRYGEPGLFQAATLRDIVEGEQVIRDERTTTELDLVLGQNFVELNPPPAGIPAGC